MSNRHKKPAASARIYRGAREQQRAPHQRQGRRRHLPEVECAAQVEAAPGRKAVWRGAQFSSIPISDGPARWPRLALIRTAWSVCLECRRARQAPRPLRKKVMPRPREPQQPLEGSRNRRLSELACRMVMVPRATRNSTPKTVRAGRRSRHRDVQRRHVPHQHGESQRSRAG
jgi:hypothetical protein